MAELTIYDSQGNRYRSSDSDPHEVSERIKNFFFGGVRVYLDIGTETELVVFFRARESKSGRAEQYYAVYQTNTASDLFTRFKDDLEHRVETEYGMTLQTTSDDVELFTKLDSGKKAVPGSNEDHRLLNSLLESGESLQCRTRSADNALALLYKYAQGNASTLAIAENARLDELDDCDLAIEVGGDDELTPIYRTESLLAKRRGTSSSNSQPSTSSRPRATPSDPERSGGRSVPRIIAVAVGGLLVFSVLALVAVNAAAFYGVADSETLDPLVVVGETETTVDETESAPTFENMTIEGQPLMEDGEFVDHVDVTVNDQNNTQIAGTINDQDRAYIAIQRDDAVVAERDALISTSVSLSVGPLTNGEGELLIAVGDDPASEDGRTAVEEISITIHGVTD